jgi:predicted nucleic acid-binding protein
LIYLDTSAVVKLVALETETAALQRWMKAQADNTFFASQLLRIELLRTVLRVAPDRLDRAREVLKGVALLEIDDAIVAAAESLPPAALRSLDAIHLATAHTLQSHVSAFVTYDVRLLEAAKGLGMNVVSP